MHEQNTRALAAIREALIGSDQNSRADLLEETTRAIYSWVKREAPGGEGLDGNDGPERHSIGRVMTEAIRHHDETTRRWVDAGRPTNFYQP